MKLLCLTCIAAMVLAVGCASAGRSEREFERRRANIAKGLRLLNNDPNSVLWVQDWILYNRYTGKWPKHSR